MSQFVTQTLDDQLTILVIAPDDNPLAKEVVNVLKKNGIVSQVITPNTKNISQVKQDIIYKYILIYQSKTPFSSVLAADFLTKLQSFQSKLLILGTIQTPFEGSIPLFGDWQAETQQQATNWQLIQQTLPEATYCLGQDVFSPGQIPVWARVITKKVPQNELYSAHFQVFPQQLDYFATTISNALLSPLRGERVLYQGAAVSLRQVAERIGRQYDLIFQTKLLEKKITTEIKDIAVEEYLLEEWKVKSSKKQFLDDLAMLVTEKLAPVEPPSVQKVELKQLPKPVQEQLQLKSQAKKVRIIKPPEPKEEAVTLAPAPAENDPTNQEEKQIESALQKLFADNQVERKINRVTTVAQETKTATTKNKRKKSIFYLGLGFVGMSLGLIVLFGGFWLSVSLLERKLLVVSQKLQETHTKTFNEESQQLAFLTSVVEAQMESYQVLLSPQLFSYPDSLVGVSKNLIGLGESLNSTRDLAQLATRQLFGSETGDVLDTLQAASNKANDVYQQLSLLQAAIEGLDQERLSTQEVQKLADFTNVVQDERKSLAIIQQLQPLMAQILGTEGKRTYAIFLQDNQELRPTGGFLNSVALVTVDQGLVIDTQVHSIYQLEKNFAGEIEPPEEIKLLLDEDKLFFHDANWEPDFSKTAQQLTFFLEKTTGHKVNGVLAIDLYGIEALIKAVGPLELPEYNEVLTDRNVHERSEFHSEITLNEEPGEQSYLPVVLQKLLNQLLLTPKENTGSVLAGLNQAFKQNHLQIYLTDVGENNSFNSLGWTGIILAPDCPVQLEQQACVVDAFYQVEANIGVNKANHYIKRNVNHQITLAETKALHQRSIIFENTAPTNAWPRGEYDSYVRFYLPDGAEFAQATIDGKIINQDAILIKNQDERTIVGLVVRVPIQTEQELVLEFTTPLPEVEQYSYAFFDQKQPGTTDDDENISITTVDNRVPAIIAPQAVVNQNTITFQYDKNQHGFVGVSFE